MLAVVVFFINDFDDEMTSKLVFFLLTMKNSLAKLHLRGMWKDRELIR